MKGIQQTVQLGEFFEQARAQAISYPQEMMLTEGIILAVLGGGLFLFLIIALFRKSGTAATAAGLTGMTALMEAQAFEKLAFLPAGSELVLQGLFVTTALLFLTAGVRIARDNALLGAILLLAMIAAFALGLAGFLGAIPAEGPMRIFIAVTAFFATVLVLHQGFGKDRRAMLIAPGVMLASASVLAMIIGGNMGVSNWIGAVTPHVMLAGGVMLAGLMALVPMGAEAAAASASGGEALGRQEPAVAFSDGKEEAREMPAGLQSEAQQAAPLVASDRPSEVAPAVVANQPEPRQEPVLTSAPAQEAPSDPAEVRQPIRAESPISALWGKKPALAAATAVPAIAAAAVSGGADWTWTSDDQVAASDQFLSLFNIDSKDELTPELMRGLIAHENLNLYDDAILGGGDAGPGSFDFTCQLLNGNSVRLTGQREVDADGFPSRISASVEQVGTGARSMPADMVQVAAQVQAEAKKTGLEKLQSALARGEIRTYFQPIVRVTDEEIIGFEALARWDQPGASESISADQFIHTAVEAGIEADIIRVVASEAVRELASWLEAQPGGGQFVTFNVTADSLLNNELVQIVSEQIKKYKLPKGSLVVELTESHVLRDANTALTIANQLKKVGARLALDDLGSGHSQISQLGKFPFDIIKTDRSLITSLPDNPQAEKLLTGIMEMAKRVGAQVVVEGVENQATARLLRDIGCEFAQGFYYGAPEVAGDPDANQELVASLR